jgi:hypothetical protein
MRLHALFQLGTDAPFLAAMHEAIDGAEHVYSDLTRSEFRAELARLDGVVEALQVELQESERARRHAEVDAAFAKGVRA